MIELQKYKALIVDLDGTLYYQKPVRIAMFIEMLLHFWRASDFLVVKKYREMYEKGLNEEARFAELPDNAPKIIQEWMINRPLKYIKRYKDRHLIKLLKNLQSDGTRIIVCSDYPVNEKLRALELSPEFAFDANDMGCLKPNAAGLMNQLRVQNIEPCNCLVIGDRYEKDGIMAENMGAKYIILFSDKKEREMIYKKAERGMKLAE